MTQPRMPVAYISHGGGPCFFMDWDPPREWDGLRAALEGIGPSLPSQPTAIVVVTAHWASHDVAVDSGATPGLIYDYGGFPAHTYQLTYPAPGSPVVANEIDSLLTAAGIPHHLEPAHGWDHGVFIPLKVMFPDAQIPVVAVSVLADFDPLAHLELGRALAPLRDQGVLIIGSGSSFHHFGNFGREEFAVPFDHWLHLTLDQPEHQRWESLVHWTDAPHARKAHGREEHLLPLMVVVGAAGADAAHSIFNQRVMSTTMSCWQFH